MQVYVNGRPVTLAPGMRVRHALTAAGFTLKEPGLLVRDEWGNEIGLDGALGEGARIFVISREGSSNDHG